LFGFERGFLLGSNRLIDESVGRAGTEGVKSTPHAIERARLLQIAKNKSKTLLNIAYMCLCLVYLVQKSEGIYRFFVHSSGTERSRLCVAVVCFRRGPERTAEHV
jgi:hypothetical protein